MRLTISTVLVMMSLSFSVTASPMMEFETSYDGSSVEATNTDGWHVGDLELALSEDLKNTQFSLAEGDSHSFDFFDIKLPFGKGSSEISATLDFLIPEGANGSGQGDGWWKSAFLISDGGLDWQEQPGLIELDDGASFHLSFEEPSGLLLGNKTTLQATVTAQSAASVPEPGSLVLLGAGLLGLGLSRKG